MINSLQKNKHSIYHAYLTRYWDVCAFISSITCYSSREYIGLGPISGNRADVRLPYWNAVYLYRF